MGRRDLAAQHRVCGVRDTIVLSDCAPVAREAKHRQRFARFRSAFDRGRGVFSAAAGVGDLALRSFAGLAEG